MIIDSKTTVNKRYLVSSRELKEALKIEGTIISIGLQIKHGNPADTDEWCINTTEKIK